MTESYVLKVLSEDKICRIDNFISLKLQNISRNQIQKLIKAGHIKKGDFAITDCKYPIKNGETYLVEIKEKQEVKLTAKKTDLDIIFEDEHFLIINKPPGLTVHPGAGNQNNTLVNALLYHCGNNLSTAGGEDRPGIVHRLDKGTSGLMLVAKTNEAHENLAEQISSHSLKRYYQALCWGIPSPQEGQITCLIGRHPVKRKKMAVVKENGKHSITHYKTLKIYSGGIISLIELKLETGRTHQIRVHMSSISNPIVGDPEYGNIKASFKKNLSTKILNEISSLNRQALHSFFIGLKHPVTGEYMEYTIDLPEDIKRIEQLTASAEFTAST